MQYRKMKSTGDELSALGFGCMRLPEKNGRIDEERATAQVRLAIDHGVNYLDTAIPYHMGASEPFLGRVLAGGYRDRVHLATKLPPWFIHGSGDIERTFATQLAKLKTDHIDYYLAHGITLASWRRLKELGFVPFVEKALADGRIRHIGFSSHAGYDEFKTIVDGYPWEFCQLQFNYLDGQSQAGLTGLEYAAGKGLGIIVMEPLRGGLLGQTAPKEVQAVWEESEIERSPAEWALRWVWNRPEVTLILSGMNEETHIEENLRIAEEARPGSLSVKELALVERAGSAFRKIMKVGCTGCRYCLPCPSGVDIPGCFLTYNNRYLGGGGSLGGSGIGYAAAVGGLLSGDKPGYASLCAACGRCVKACPQHLDIPAYLTEVKKEFEGLGFPLTRSVMSLFLKFDRWRNMRRARKAASA